MLQDQQTAELESNVRSLLESIGEDPDRQGLLETPARVVRAYRELYAGYGNDSVPEQLCSRRFKSTADQMVVLKDIEVFSMCEHHMLPFFGKCHVGYLPNDWVIGVSKIARLVRHFCSRLQIQESLTDQIAESLYKGLDCLGVVVMIEATHTCMIGRGVREHEATLITSSLKGRFLDKDSTLKQEFFSLVGR